MKQLTVQNNEIECIDLKPEKWEKTVLTIGVFHGDEPEGEYLIRRFLSCHPEPKNRLLFIPCLNPDGKNVNKRTNGRGVDLNRNFPTSNWVNSKKDEYYGGDFSGSEFETKFITEIIDKYHPDAILTLHAPYKVVNYDGPANALAKIISGITGYPVQENIGYPTPGSFGTYCGIERNIPTITLELPENEESEKLWMDNKGVFEYFALTY